MPVGAQKESIFSHSPSLSLSLSRIRIKQGIIRAIHKSSCALARKQEKRRPTTSDPAKAKERPRARYAQASLPAKRRRPSREMELRRLNSISLTGAK